MNPRLPPLLSVPLFCYLREMELLLATGNPHKREEFARIFRGHRLLLPADRGVRFDHEETGASFLENALGKARALRALLSRSDAEGMPILADDSGLAVAALGGEPGVYSARYGRQERGRDLSDGERNLFLLERMAALEDRRACFVCALVLLLDENRIYAAQETLPGLVGREPRGEGGFGYDPLLVLPHRGRTVAQLTPEEKDLLSHRGKAARALLAVVEHHLSGRTA